MTDLADAIDKIKTQFEGVQSAMKTAQDELAKTKAEHDEWEHKLVNKRGQHRAMVSELEAKKLAADRAAEENARRIQLNNDQVHEITRIRAELDKRDKNLVLLEQKAAAKVDEYVKKAEALARREADVDRKEAEIKARYAKMKEAIG